MKPSDQEIISQNYFVQFILKLLVIFLLVW